MKYWLLNCIILIELQYYNREFFFTHNNKYKWEADPWCKILRIPPSWWDIFQYQFGNCLLLVALKPNLKVIDSRKTWSSNCNANPVTNFYSNFRSNSNKAKNLPELELLLFFCLFFFIFNSNSNKNFSHSNRRENDKPWQKREMIKQHSI